RFYDSSATLRDWRHELRRQVQLSWGTDRLGNPRTGGGDVHRSANGGCFDEPRVRADGHLVVRCHSEDCCIWLWGGGQRRASVYRQYLDGGGGNHPSAWACRDHERLDR